MKIITMTLLKLDKNQQKERENVNTTDLALARRLSRKGRDRKRRKYVKRMRKGKREKLKKSKRRKSEWTREEKRWKGGTPAPREVNHIQFLLAILVCFSLSGHRHKGSETH